MPYIKSYSNYVLKSKHQDINDGTIYERDITTIGGVDNFSPGQTPIYRSNNFIISVRNDNAIANQYNTEKWEDNPSGDVWTLETISGITSSRDEDNDTKIVLKQDYYDFRDFAYYGSLTELFRVSVTDIVSRFPGELYHTSNNVYYTSGYTEDFDRLEDSVLLGGSSLTEVVNPFGINLHSSKRREDMHELKYFANEGWKNYDIIVGDTLEPITSWKSTYYYSERANDKTYNHYTASTTSNTISSTSGHSKPYPCKGDKMAEIVINGNYNISAWIGNNGVVYYLSETEGNWHIRPKKHFLDEFYNTCDNFEKLLMNEDTGYKAVFSVIRENDYGYYREFVPFEFPKGAGEYNIDTADYGFNTYTDQMVRIGEYYDEHFTDNLWRSMTHEAIKNFDWTYTREYQEGEEEEYVFGGQRIQKALRLFGREFDEIIAYINNIKAINRITYDERSNLPDYFLTDAVENSGWNVKLIYPYTLIEKDNNGNTVDDYTEGNCFGQLDNTTSDGTPITREFSQDANATVRPYAYSDANYPYGYFNICSAECGCDTTTITMDGTDNGIIYDEYGKASATSFSDTVRFDKNALSGKGALKNVIRNYRDEIKWSYQKGNNEFLRRLKINSPYIWRHKGTIDGVEMILGMFGLKSKRMGGDDYDITEYSSFAHKIEDTWDVLHQDYRINWINSTKTLIYNSVKTDYQGLMVSYKDEYVNSYTRETAYIGKDSTISSVIPSSSGECFTRSDGSPVLRRYLYPNFNNTEELDGNPYFQMNGGWLSKVIDDKWNFQYDADDNIVYSTYLKAGIDNENGIQDNDTLYKETVRNIRRVDSIGSLLSLPNNTLHSGIMCYVTNIEKNSAVIDNEVYPIINDISGSYIVFTKIDGYVKVGNSKFFDTAIIVYNADGEETLYDVESRLNGYEIKAYLKDNTFICKEDPQGNYSITNFQIIEDNEEMSNYFVLDDVNYSDILAQLDTDNDRKTYTNGWKRVAYNSSEYLRVNTIVNDTKGNNPHNGNMEYDNGHEYLVHFKRIFKHASDNNLFDERCYGNFNDDLYSEINSYGFKGLVNDNEGIKQYDNLISADTKIHYFGNYKTKKNDNSISEIYIYGDNKEKADNYKTIYSGETNNIKMYNIGDMDVYPDDADEVTNQIVNNKRLTIDFKLHTNWYTNQGQCEIKYLDTIVMNYLTQMIPSNTIVQIKYTSKQ